MSIISCPAFRRASAVISMALRTGGLGRTTPSSLMRPNVSFCGRVIFRQGIGIIFGSIYHGSAETTVDAKRDRAERERDIGPLTELIAS